VASPLQGVVRPAVLRAKWWAGQRVRCSSTGRRSHWQGGPSMAPSCQAADENAKGSHGCRARLRMLRRSQSRIRSAGVEEGEIEWSGGTVADLKAALGRRWPAIAPLLARSTVAVGGRYAADDLVVGVGTADVAVMGVVATSGSSHS